MLSGMRCFSGVSVGNELACNAGDAEDPVSIHVGSQFPNQGLNLYPLW